MDTRYIESIVNILEKSSLTALEIEEPDFKIRLERINSDHGKTQRDINTVSEPFIKDFSQKPQSKQDLVIDNNSSEQKTNIEVKSPMVGVFYGSSSPEADPYVKIGSKVKKGDILCIIEAMKLMNEITAEEDGEVIEICVKDSDIVEFSQVLFKMS